MADQLATMTKEVVAEGRLEVTIDDHDIQLLLAEGTLGDRETFILCLSGVQLDGVKQPEGPDPALCLSRRAVMELEQACRLVLAR